MDSAPTPARASSDGPRLRLWKLPLLVGGFFLGLWFYDHCHTWSPGVPVGIATWTATLVIALRCR